MARHTRVLAPWIIPLVAACSPGGQGPAIYLGPPGTSATHAVVTVQKGTIEGETWRFRSIARNDGRESTAMLPEQAPTSPLTYPAVYAVVAEDWTGPTELELEALDKAGNPIGRARGVVELQRQKGVTTELTLRRPCSAATECSNGRFCDGEEVCDQGICQDGPPPCRSAFACASFTCLEDMDDCSVAVDHSQCPPRDDGDGPYERYCDPGAGCVRGESCTTNADCQDTSTCNGDELCVGFRCVAGVPPPLDDQNDCTRDACVEGEGRVNLPVPDGNACTRTGMPDGLCLSGTCGTSSCGDGFRDALAATPEECDLGTSNSDTTPNTCRTSCRLPYCGDGVPDLGEECDDGNTVDTDTCRNTCEENICGDGVTNTGVEECDDGNDNDSDACRNSCANNVCGDGVRNPAAEACDDGNSNPNDGCHACALTSWPAEVLLGFGQSGGDPLKLPLTYPEGLVQDRLGNLFFAEYGGRIWRLDAATGGLTRVAGTAQAGYSGDLGPATSAELSEPQGVVLDERGNMYFCDGANNAIRRIDRQGTITTLAGNGEPGDSGDGGQARLALLNYPAGIARDRFGNLYFADQNNNRVRKITTNGRISTVAGTGTPGYSGDSGPAVDAQLNRPWGVLVDDDGTLIISERRGNRIRKVSPGGIITTLAGDGTEGFLDGDASQAQFAGPMGMTRLPNGSLLVADSLNHRVRRISTTGTVDTFAGTGEAGYDGDGGPATSALFTQPVWVISDASGVVHISDEFNQKVRRVALDGTITTVVGLQGTLYEGFGNQARDAFMAGPNGVAVGADGSIYIAEYEGHRIRRVFPTGVIRTVAGNGEPGDSGDDGPALDALLAFPDSLAIDPDGNLLFTDSGNNRVRKIDVLGRITTVAGDGTPGFGGDGGPATSAQLDGPSGLAVDSLGNIYFSDALNHRIRKIDLAGTITTVAGDGSETYGGDGGPALSAGIAHVYGIAVDSQFNIYMADDVAHRVRRVTPTGSISTIAGNGVAESSGDGMQAADASLSQPGAVLVDATGNIYISDTYGNRIRRIGTNGIINTVVGTGDGAFYGDFGPAVDGAISRPYQITFDMAGNLLITDYGNGLLRSVSPTGVLTTVAGSAHPGDGPFAVAQLNDPVALTRLGSSPDVLVVDGRGGRLRQADFTQELLLTVAGYPRAPTGAAVVPAIGSRLLDGATGIAFDAAQNKLYISERRANVIHRVSLLDPADPQTWVIEVYAGASTGLEHADGVLADARFNLPSGLVFDAQSRILYVAEAGNHDVRAIRVDTPDLDGCVTTVAGIPGAQGFYGEDVAAVGALFDTPEALALTPQGDLYIADTVNHRVRRLDMQSGRVHTVIGDGTPAASGQGSPAIFFTVDSPRGLVVDSFGNLFITSRYALRVVTAGADGLATGEDEVLTIYGRTPRDIFPESVTQCLSGILMEDGDGSLLMTDTCQGFLMRLTRTAVMGP